MAHPTAAAAAEPQLREALERREAEVQVLAGRVTALTEENERMRKERDSLQQRLEELQAELQETAEETRAAVRFADAEWREHCDRAEAQCARLQSIASSAVDTALAFLPYAEAAARQQLQGEENEARRALVLFGYRTAVATAAATDEETRGNEETARINFIPQIHLLCCALGCTLCDLQDNFLGKESHKGSEEYFDTSAPARGLWELYLALCEVGFPTDAAMKELLCGEEKIGMLFFNAAGHAPCFSHCNYAIAPSAAAYDFFHRVLRHLPRLQALRCCHLPPLSSPEGRAWVAGAPRTLQYLRLLHTDYTVADLHALRARCPSLGSLGIHVSRCTDWGHFAGIADVEERKRQLKQACGNIVSWEV